MLPLTFVPPTLNGRQLSRTDFDVFEDRECIGRVYEVHAPPSPDMAWFWTITARVPNAAGGVRMNGYATTFQDAKAQFQEHWFKAWKRAPARGGMSGL